METETLQRSIRPLSGGSGDFDPVLDRIGSASVVLIGEASHGTHEFYEARAEITRRLIVERSLGAVIVEADWPDAYRVNRYVRGEGEDGSAEQALADFERFPRWMWRNTEVVRFVEWLREHNASRAASERVGFYGMDLYSMYRSIDAVLRFLSTVDPAAEARARARYSCFGHFGKRAELYGRAAGLGLVPSCEQAAVAQLMDLRDLAEEHVRAGGYAARDHQFTAEQNARLVRNAEQYYRAMFGGHLNTWNMRDAHMVETVEALRDHLSSSSSSARVCVWAHNSHLGDARATEQGRAGQFNVGQGLRERHCDDCVIVGFTTHTGTVTAASDWDGPAERKRVRPSLDGSWERLLHDSASSADHVLVMDELATHEARTIVHGSRLNRAIGVIYRPRTERLSHYFQSVLGAQFDVVIHYDETRALQPLELWATPEHRDLDETYPFGV